MQFRVLGPLEVSDQGQPLALGTPRQRRLLGLLLLHAGDAVTYDRLADGLWDGHPPPTARHTLQGYVHRLRLALGDQAGRLETRPLGYQLKVSDGELDARTFEDLVASGRRALVRGDAGEATSHFEAALDLWFGLPFEDLGDLPVFEAERARLEALRLTALEDRVDAELALGHHDAIIAEVETLLADHPFRERLWGQLMVARYRAGRQADALKAFRRARDMLADELGLQPARWLCRLQEQILLQDPVLDPPAATRAPRLHHNLPASRDSFVGRGRELADIDGLLRTRRLVTITGPPGTGKTRLVVEAAARLVEDWPHGVFLVPLAEVEDATLVPAVIATTVGVPTVAEQPVLDTLAGHLRSRRVLLVLDNVEHVLAAARQVAALLDAAAQLTVLATSRAPLRLAGEQEYPLHPLPLPQGDAPAEASGGNDAVTLFVDRASAIDPDFAVTPENSSLVTKIVARLDGLPLAIELAAARLRTFSLVDLHNRLEPALPLLAGGTVEQPRHHHTLREAVAWSDDMLDPRQRVALRRLAPFRGGITIEAAQAVIGHAHGDVVGSLARLVEASLLGRPTHDQPPKYRLLETIREYALERLRAAGEEHEIRQRHATFHATVLAQAAPHLTQAGQAQWLQRLDVEHANLRAALGWAVEAGEADLALEMAAGLWRYWQLRGHLAEGREWLTRALDLEGSSPLPHVRALIGLAGICYWQFDLDAAEATYRRAREEARDLDWWLHLDALFGLGMTLACHRGDLAEAKAFESEFWALIGEHDDDPMATGLALAAVQAMRLLAGDLEESRRYGEMCLEGTRQLGERWYELQMLRTLALTSLRQERYDQARDELRECVSIASELGDLPGIAMDFDRLGQVAVLLGEPEHGCVLAGVAESLREQVGETITPEAFRWEKDPATITASRTLGETEIERARARGHILTLQEAAKLVETS